MVRRDGAMDALVACQARALTLIRAPAGFGKTTLLTAWREHLLSSHQIVGWLSLDEDDNDLSRFAEYLVESFRGLADTTPEFQLGGEGVSTKTLLAWLINLVEGADQQITLVLDDYHWISEPRIHDLISCLLQHIPGNFHLIISSRSEPPLPLSSLLAHGELGILDAGALRFGLDEARDFLSATTSVRLSASETRALHEATEGWVAGLQIAAFVLPEHNSVEQLLTSISGQSRAFSDYLSENVLSRIPDATVAFMLRSSIVERLTADLCEHVTGVSGAQQLLHWLVSQNLFLQGLDGSGSWYKYHSLFADFLRARLKIEFSEELTGLHLKAAYWYAQHEYWADAVRHALIAERTDLAADWFERCAMQELQNCRVNNILAWANKLPASALKCKPRLQFVRAWALISTMKFAEAFAVIESVEMELKVQPQGVDDDTLRELLALRFASLALMDNSTRALEISRSSLPTSEELTRKWPGSWIAEAIQNCLILCHGKAGNLEVARSIDYNNRLGVDLNRNLFLTSYRVCLLALTEN